MNKEQLEKRKKLIAELILENEFYVPMKTKEIAILLQIPKSQRGELQEVLDSLVSDGTIGISKKGNTENRIIRRLSVYLPAPGEVSALLR